MRIYLDNAATTPVDPRVVEAMQSYWTAYYGNPSSSHSEGQAARDGVERARDQVAALLGANRDEIIFTSGGSEADNTAIKLAFALSGKGNHLICSSIEHDAVLKTMQYMTGMGFDLTVLPVDGLGRVDPDDVRKAITAKTVLISVHHANNEIGTIEPIAEIGRIAHEHDVLFHSDAVQTFGHVPISVAELNIDMLALSAHKLYGPKGVGALYLKRGTGFTPLIHGGGQEDHRRASTSNVAGIAGLGMAAEIARVEMAEEHDRIRRLRDGLWQALGDAMEGLILNGHAVQRLDNNLNFSIQGVEGESLLMALDIEGLAASSGSACSSGSGRGSHVLAATGNGAAQGQGSLRLSLGRFTTEDDVLKATEIIVKAVHRLRQLSGF